MDEKEIPENLGENDNETGDGINTTDIKEVSENNCTKSEENSECGPSEPNSIQNHLECDVIKSDIVEKSEKCDEQGDVEVSVSVGDDTKDIGEIQKGMSVIIIYIYTHFIIIFCYIFIELK